MGDSKLENSRHFLQMKDEHRDSFITQTSQVIHTKLNKEEYNVIILSHNITFTNEILSKVEMVMISSITQI